MKIKQYVVEQKIKLMEEATAQRRDRNYYEVERQFDPSSISMITTTRRAPKAVFSNSLAC